MVVALQTVLAVSLRDWPTARGVTEDGTLVRYTIRGTTPSELRRQMDALGRQRYAGYTSSQTYWHYHYDWGNGSCRIGSVQVSVADTVSLPDWYPPPKTDPALVAEWGRFLAMLKRHEEGHREISIATAAAIETTIAQLEPASSCEALGQTANAVGQRLLASAKQEQERYDQDTRHGARQGAWLEPLDAELPIGPQMTALAVILTMIGGLLRLATRPGWRINRHIQ